MWRATHHSSRMSHITALYNSVTHHSWRNSIPAVWHLRYLISLPVSPNPLPLGWQRKYLFVACKMLSSPLGHCARLQKTSQRPAGLAAAKGRCNWRPVVLTVHWPNYSTLYNAHCTLYTVYFTLYTLLCTLYTVHFKLYTVIYPIPTVYGKLCTVNYTLLTVHCIIGIFQTHKYLLSQLYTVY